MVDQVWQFNTQKYNKLGHNIYWQIIRTKQLAIAKLECHNFMRTKLFLLLLLQSYTLLKTFWKFTLKIININTKPIYNTHYHTEKSWNKSFRREIIHVFPSRESNIVHHFDSQKTYYWCISTDGIKSVFMPQYNCHNQYKVVVVHVKNIDLHNMKTSSWESLFQIYNFANKTRNLIICDIS